MFTVNSLSTMTEYALITGASKGIGKNIVEELARRGFNVLLVARSGDLLKQVAAEISSRYTVKVDWLPVDPSAPNAPPKAVHWCKPKQYSCKALVNNAWSR